MGATSLKVALCSQRVQHSTHDHLIEMYADPDPMNAFCQTLDLTLSKWTLMEPTLVAPTAAMLKKP